MILLVLLPGLACSLTGARYRFNNEVRQAVFDYAHEAYGPVDDLILHFERGEPRTRFAQQHEEGGRTVWLYLAGAKEYFGVRPPETTYLYIQEIEYDEQRAAATVTVYRGSGTGYQGHQLTLGRGAGGEWTVEDDVEIARE